METVGSRKVFTVQEHKTGAYQPASFSLSLEHCEIFEAYHCRVQATIATITGSEANAMRQYFFVRHPIRDKNAKRLLKAGQEVRLSILLDSNLCILHVLIISIFNNIWFYFQLLHFQKNSLKMSPHEIVTATECRKAIQTAVKR